MLSLRKTSQCMAIWQLVIMTKRLMSMSTPVMMLASRTAIKCPIKRSLTESMVCREALSMKQQWSWLRPMKTFFGLTSMLASTTVMLKAKFITRMSLLMSQRLS